MNNCNSLLGLGLGLILSFASCNNAVTTTNPNAICYTCTKKSKPDCTVDVCKGRAIAIDCGVGGLLDGNTNEELRRAYIAAGYRCKKQ